MQTSRKIWQNLYMWYYVNNLHKCVHRQNMLSRFKRCYKLCINFNCLSFGEKCVPCTDKQVLKIYHHQYILLSINLLICVCHLVWVTFIFFLSQPTNSLTVCFLFSVPQIFLSILTVVFSVLFILCPCLACFWV